VGLVRRKRDGAVGTHREGDGGQGCGRRTAGRQAGRGRQRQGGRGPASPPGRTPSRAAHVSPPRMPSPSHRLMVLTGGPSCKEFGKIDGIAQKVLRSKGIGWHRRVAVKVSSRAGPASTPPGERRPGMLSSRSRNAVPCNRAEASSRNSNVTMPVGTVSRSRDWSLRSATAEVRQGALRVRVSRSDRGVGGSGRRRPRRRRRAIPGASRSPRRGAHRGPVRAVQAGVDQVGLRAVDVAPHVLPPDGRERAVHARRRELLAQQGRSRCSSSSAAGPPPGRRARSRQPPAARRAPPVRGHRGGGRTGRRPGRGRRRAP